MGWAAIIAAILSFIEPFIAKWIAGSTQSRLEKTASNLPEPKEFGGTDKAVDQLLDATISNLPRFAFGRRLALRRLKGALAERFAEGGVTEADGSLQFSPPTSEERGEMGDWVSVVEND